MRAKSYPHLEHHQQQHRYFETQVSQFESDREKGTAQTAESLLVFLRDWFLEHILEQDRGFVPHVR